MGNDDMQQDAEHVLRTIARLVLPAMITKRLRDAGMTADVAYVSRALEHADGFVIECSAGCGAIAISPTPLPPDALSICPRCLGLAMHDGT